MSALNRIPDQWQRLRELPGACATAGVQSPVQVNDGRRFFREQPTREGEPTPVSTLTQEQPVTNRMRIPQEQSPSGTLGRWQPNRWVFGIGGINASIAAQTASTTSVSSARMMSLTSTWSLVGSHPESNLGPHNDRWMVTY